MNDTQVEQRIFLGTFQIGKRDYDGLIIGSKSISKGEEEKMLCVSFDRSLQMSRLILERMYSFLKKD